MGAFDFLRTDRNLPGYWDPVNSTIDWCELNYVYTFYIAELWNTLTNVPFILGGAWMAYRFAKNGIPWRYIAYLVWDTNPGWEPRWGALGPMLVASWVIFATAFYLISKNPVIHEVTFAVLVTMNVFRTTYLSYRLPAARKAKVLKTLWTGAGMVILAFAIWNLDNQLCHVWRDLRDRLSESGLGFLAPLTEGHGWWHILANVGACLMYTAIIDVLLAVKTSPAMWDYDETKWFPVERRVKAEGKSL